MSARKVGRGRVLGNSQNPPAAPSPLNPSLFSPSGSSLSVNSSATSQLSTDAQDISSRISYGQNDETGTAAAAAAITRLVCPICNEEMVTLLQLNRHLDDNHKNLEEVQQDEVKDWFERQMAKAKRFQPLAVLNQKFKGLEVFEPNEVQPSPVIRPVNSTPEPAPQDPEQVITRAHWQRRGPEDQCSDPACGKRLNTMSGSVNCRHCGKLFCDEHTMYQMKLSRSAQHEPVRGLWCRVCETCYKSREGYNDRRGAEVDHTQDFLQLRQKTVDKTLLEISRLEKRLTKLTQLLANAPPEQSLALWPLTGARNQRKQLEQSVVDWEDDASVPRCPFCQQEFSTYVFRRHHCRVCGRVVCADPLTDCSKDVPLTVATAPDTSTTTSEKLTTAGAQTALDIRICKSCNHTLFHRADFSASIAHRPPDSKAYENLIAFERGILSMLPRFHKLLHALQDPNTPPMPAQLADASRTRKRLVDAFGHASVAAKRVRDLPTTSETQKKLQMAIYQSSYNFLQLHMLPLKALPKILKHAAASTPTPNGHLSNGQPGKKGALASIGFNSLTPGSGSDDGVSVSSVALSELEAQEKEARETLMVLEEQLFMVREQHRHAKKGRRFDEAEALGRNVADLEREVGRVRSEVEKVGEGFEGVYAGS